MARAFTSGFELNSAAATYDWNLTGGSPTISTTTVRSGIYAGRISSLSSGVSKHFGRTFAGTGGVAIAFARAYINIATLPSAGNRIMRLQKYGGAAMAWLTLNADGTLQLSDEDGTVGSPSAALSTGTWYMLELKLDRTVAGSNHIVEARLDGTIFATASNRNLSSSYNGFHVGGNLATEAQTQGDWFFDDCAVNDATGSAQTSYPGSGKVIRLTPDAVGDSSQWIPTAGANYTNVDEITPNDATDIVSSAVLNDVDLYNCSVSGIGATDTVNVVEINARFRNSTADATTAVKFEIEKTSGGTIQQSAALIPNSVSWGWNTPNNGAVPRTAPLVTYLDPDGAAWTQATLDTMQVGQKLTALGTNAIQVSTVLVLVDYTPSSSTIPRSGFVNFQNPGTF